MLSGEAFEHQPIFDKDLALKNSLLVIGKNDAILGVDEEFTATRFS